MTPRHPERGLTLTEITVVFVLAGLVMTGVVAFYLNAQTVWVDGSAQAITQREASLVLDAIATRARSAKSAAWGGDARHARIYLSFPDKPDADSVYGYWWNASDSLIHEGYPNIPLDRGPMLTSQVDCFSATCSDSLVTIDTLRVRSSHGTLVTMATSVALVNRGAH
jgi:type II secretory pathway pseudopilin PulG